MINKLDIVSVTIIENSIQNVFEELSFFIEEGKIKKYKISEQPLTLNDVYSNEPQKGGSHFSRFLIWEPKNLTGQTAFFSNNQDGRYTLIYNYCKTYKRKAIMAIFSTADTVEYPVSKLIFFNYEDGFEVERCIYCIKEERQWIFYTKGPIQSFEDPSNYKKRVKSERFNKDIILSYLLKMGIDIDNKSFWIATNDVSFYFSQIVW